MMKYFIWANQIFARDKYSESVFDGSVLGYYIACPTGSGKNIYINYFEAFDKKEDAIAYLRERARFILDNCKFYEDGGL